MPNNSRIITKKLSDKFFVFRRKIDPNFRIFGLNFKRKYGKVYYVPYSGTLLAHQGRLHEMGSEFEFKIVQPKVCQKGLAAL